MRSREFVAVSFVALLLVSASSVGAVGTTNNPEIIDVTFVSVEDADSDGAISGFEMTVTADTRLESTDITGNNPGEPYFEVEIDGEDVYRSEIVSRQSQYQFTLTFDAQTLEEWNLEEDTHELTVELWDADGDAIDSTDVGNDDEIDSRTFEFQYERSVDLSLEAARSQTVVGSPVALRVPRGYSGVLTWDVTAAPSGSDAQLRAHENTATIRPDATGTYRIRVSGADGASATVEFQATSSQQIHALRQYAPQINFARGEQYRPTRYEALIYNAELEELGSEDIEDPTLFDISERPDGWELDMQGSESDYTQYDDEFPRTVYGSVHSDVVYRGQSYTALTYWLFYVYDPKQPDSIASLVAHESDLETVTILVNESGPQWVAASQHYGGEVREWEKAPRDGQHVKIYPALGAHSNYFRNTKKYQRAGIPIQDQFINKDSQETFISSLAEGIYVDRTGNATQWSHDGSVGRDYQVVPLTGREVWATYRGSMGPSDDQGKIPYQRTRWRNLDIWLRETPVPDELQVSGRIRTADFSVSETRTSVDIRLGNTGPKPHTFSVVLEAVRTGGGPRDGEARILDRATVPLGSNFNATGTLAGEPPTVPGTWRFRVRLLAYHPDIAGQGDLLDEPAVSQSELVISTPTPSPTPTPTPTALPETDSGSDSDRGTLSSGGGPSDSDSTPVRTPTSGDGPGFGVSVAVTSVLLASLFAVRFRRI